MEELIQKNENNKNPLDFFVEQAESDEALRDDLNKSYLEYRIENIKQKRDFFQHLTILSGAITGFSSVFGYKEILNPPLFQIGFFLNLIFIIAVTSYFREILDTEGNELLSQQDRYNLIIKDREKILQNYLKKQTLTKEDILKYLEEVESKESAKNLKAEIEKLDKERLERLNGKKDMDYSGELFVLIFVFASFFISSSFFWEKINWYSLVLISFIIICLVFTDSISFFIKKLSKSINFIKNKIK